MISGPSSPPIFLSRKNGIRSLHSEQQPRLGSKLDQKCTACRRKNPSFAYILWRSDHPFICPVRYNLAALRELVFHYLSKHSGATHFPETRIRPSSFKEQASRFFAARLCKPWFRSESSSGRIRFSSDYNLRNSLHKTVRSAPTRIATVKRIESMARIFLEESLRRAFRT